MLRLLHERPQAAQGSSVPGLARRAGGARVPGRPDPPVASPARPPELSRSDSRQGGHGLAVVACAVLGHAQGVEQRTVTRHEPAGGLGVLARPGDTPPVQRPGGDTTDQLTSLRRDGDSGICSAKVMARRRIGSLSVLSPRRLARTGGRSSSLLYRALTRRSASWSSSRSP